MCYLNTTEHMRIFLDYMTAIRRIKNSLLGLPALNSSNGTTRTNHKMENTIRKAELSFDSFFKDLPKGGMFMCIPDDLADYLNQVDNCVKGITDNLIQNKQYRITICFEQIVD